jgi:hypothetical protein
LEKSGNPVKPQDCEGINWLNQLGGSTGPHFCFVSRYFEGPYCDNSEQLFQVKISVFFKTRFIAVTAVAFCHILLLGC